MRFSLRPSWRVWIDLQAKNGRFWKCLRGTKLLTKAKVLNRLYNRCGETLSWHDFRAHVRTPTRANFVIYTLNYPAIQDESSRNRTNQPETGRIKPEQDDSTRNKTNQSETRRIELKNYESSRWWTLPSFIPPTHQRAVRAWVGQHPTNQAETGRSSWTDRYESIPIARLYESAHIKG